MYDQREKAQRDYEWGLASAREEVREEGLLYGRVQMLQALLGDPETPASGLRAKTTAELDQLLQQRLRHNA